MSLRNAALFDPEGKGTPVLFGQLRSRTPLRPLQSRAVLVEEGLATRYFADWWRVAFPDRSPMPRDPVAESDGRGTSRFWDLIRP